VSRHWRFKELILSRAETYHVFLKTILLVLFIMYGERNEKKYKKKRKKWGKKRGKKCRKKRKKEKEKQNGEKKWRKKKN